mmetsp:Transcript_25627/g.101118  ORF Transcript_25627/g.101118 Transcript_25627/m.101118 type:complete len:268 (-) Transcript_25627:410-1213(-)|eukprot:CAMPEP_0113958168 /NCGR_PEP_ID=MMETSP0011_2-20120614/3220_1 /TAXON_ID=101924 /ORGANISM="Rhodosorus marinus" /LENGTH=267 /DNA_ID=CAMNT_0000968901 /DNA_START=104 /DNA_END=907 /DNA_ORIENTATION=- /assembly_acc=CAM_ASM_000156
MPAKSKSKGKKVAPAPLAVRKAAGKTPKNPLFEKRPRNFGIGQAVQPRRDLSRYVKWPQYVRLQRQRKILLQRLKVPPALTQFTRTMDKNMTTQLLKILNKHRPEDKAQKRDRLNTLAESKAEGGSGETTKKPIVVKYGLNHIVDLVESKKATLVVIAHDVEPIELVVWLPTLCKKMDVPYCIVKSKARLGKVVHKKTAAALAFTTVKSEDKPEFAKLVQSVRASYNDKYEDVRKVWGGGILGIKSQHKEAKHQKALAAEEAKRMQV